MHESACKDAPAGLNVHEGYEYAQEHYARDEHQCMEDRILQKRILGLTGRKIPGQMPDRPDKAQDQRALQETELQKEPVERIASPAELLVEGA